MGRLAHVVGMGSRRMGRRDREAGARRQIQAHSSESSDVWTPLKTPGEHLTEDAYAGERGRRAVLRAEAIAENAPRAAPPLEGTEKIGARPTNRPRRDAWAGSSKCSGSRRAGDEVPPPRPKHAEEIVAMIRHSESGPFEYCGEQAGRAGPLSICF